MAATRDPSMENLDPLPSPQQPGSAPNQEDNSMLGLDGSQASMRSVSLVLQALVPLVISFILLLAGRRLYRFTTTVSVGLSCALFTWALFVNLETGQSIGGWTGEVAALTVWSVMIGGGLIGSIIGYQSTWWGAHVTGRLCLGANSGVSFAFSILLFKAGLLIHTTAGQWALVSVCAILGGLAVLFDLVVGPLLAISLSGSFLFLLGVDLFSTSGIGGIASGLRLLMDHNPDHQVLMTPYNPSKSTEILIIVSWVIAAISFGFQYFFFKIPFGPLPPSAEEDEEERLGSEGKTKESFSQGSSDDPKKEIPTTSEGDPHADEQNHIINITDPHASTEASVCPKTSTTKVEPNRVAVQQVSESSNVPQVASRAGPVVVGDYGSPPALALSPTVYSRYRRTLDAEHKPPGRSPIQYTFHSNPNHFTNPRRVETVDEVTETSTNGRGGDHTARSSMLTVAGTSEKRPRSNSVSEEYLHAMMRLAAGDGTENSNTAKAGEEQDTSGTRPIAGSSQDNSCATATMPSYEAQSGKVLPVIAETPILTGDSSSPETGPKPLEHRNPDQNIITSGAGSPRPISAPLLALSTTGATEKTSLTPNQTGIPPDERPSQPTVFPSASRDQSPNIHHKHISRTQSKPPSFSSFRPVLSTENRVQEEAQKNDGGTSRSRGPVLSNTKNSSPSESNSGQGRESYVEPACRLQASPSQGSHRQSRLSEQPSENPSSTRTHDEVAHAGALKRFSHRPLPLLPERTQGLVGFPPTSQKFQDTGSLTSATSNSSSGVDSSTRAERETSTPPTPSWSGNIIPDDSYRKEGTTSSRKKLSIVITKNPVQVERGPASVATSQEAERENYTDFSTAVPHTPTLGNMLLRVAEGSEKTKTAETLHNGNQPSHISRDDALAVTNGSNETVCREDDGDGETVKSGRWKRSTVCLSSVYGDDHTSADEGGRSSSGSEYDEVEEEVEEVEEVKVKQEMLSSSTPRGKLKEGLEETMGELRMMISDAEGSPSLDTIPVASRPDEAETTSAPKTGEGSTRRSAFVGQPLATVPWPQKRTPTVVGGGQRVKEEKSKRWSNASSIFPPLGYESATESPADRRRVSSQCAQLRSPDAHHHIDTPAHPPPFWSASSHVRHDEEYDFTSSLGHADETDADYESAADYSRSIRASQGAVEVDYLTSDENETDGIPT
ncbi:uncharacterized protein VP01_421g10 [Puccinia sorghi]|uniref:TM7S3/TM198-like domain-containing protein n=1 Tax=Puccinia sorghi TaxID=27349 RepID=A0A0L6URG3_9BASI|nr:uncharacterized protein VP01_421g10 [Puccinia sorghi]